MNDWVDLIIMIGIMGITQVILLFIYKRYNLPKILRNKLKNKFSLVLLILCFLVLINIIWFKISEFFGLPHSIFIIVYGIILGISVSLFPNYSK